MMPVGQRGAALVVAMLVAAIAAAAAVSMSTDSLRRLARYEGRRDHARAVSLAAAALQWSRGVLADDAARGPIDHLGEPWAIPLPPTPIDGGTIEGRILDAQARLNLNALGGADAASSAARARLARLAGRRGVDPLIVATIADWVDADATPREGGAEDSAYRDERRLAANAPITRAAEIAFVRGLSAGVVARLGTDLIALPADAPLNVNTASPDVLAAAIPGLDANALASLAADRIERPFVSIDDLRARVRSAGAEITDGAGLAVSSRYFLVSVRARQGEALARGEALVERTDGRPPAIVWQIVE